MNLRNVCKGIIFTSFVIFLTGFGAPPSDQGSQSIQTSIQIPDQYAKKMVLFFPKDKQIVSKNKITIKGINRYLTAVFVDGKRIPVQKDGRFRYMLTVPEVGKKVVTVSFVTPDYRTVHIKRRIIRLHSQPKKGVNRHLTQNQMFFFQYKICR